MSNEAVIVILPDHLLDDGTVEKWKSTREEYEIHTDMESALDSTSTDVGLFDSNKDLYVTASEVKADDMRSLISSAQGVDVMVVTPKKPRAKFDKDGVTTIDLSIIDKKSLAMLSAKTSIPAHIIATIYKQNDGNINTTLSMINQLSSIDDMSNYRYGDLYDLFPGDNPPWDITNSIVDGNVKNAVSSLGDHLSKYKKKADIVGLSFQLAGYFRKVIVAGDDAGELIKGNSPFYSYYSKIKNISGLIDDLAFYPDMVIKSKNPDIILNSMVSSMASRF